MTTVLAILCVVAVTVAILAAMTIRKQLVELQLLQKTLAARDCELQELRSHLRANSCRLRAEARFEAYAFKKGCEDYVQYLVDTLIHSLAESTAKTLRCYIMEAVCSHIHELACGEAVKVVIDLPVVRADIGGADVYAVGPLGYLCPLMDKGPMKELKERNEAAIAAAAMAEPGSVGEEMARQLLEGFGMCKPEELEDEKC